MGSLAISCKKEDLKQKEKDLKSPRFSETYIVKLQQHGVLTIVNKNKKIMEAFFAFVDPALSNTSEYVRNKHDPILEQEKDDIEDQRRKSVDSLIENEIQKRI